MRALRAVHGTRAHVALGAALLVAAALAACSGDPAPRARNLLLISIDTLRADHLGCYGAARDPSPFLDRLAADGILFERARATAPWTLPSHASMLMGVYPIRHGATHSSGRLAPGIPTLAERLHAAGFATGAVVNVMLLGENYGFARGFDHFQRIPASDTPAGSASQINDLALDWWQAAGDARRFLFLHYFDVHSDYGALPEYERFVPAEGRFSGTTREIMSLRAHPNAASAVDVARLEALYDAGILQLDARIGELLHALDTRGDLAETLVIVTSDHGEEFDDHGNFSHGHTLYRELLHVPLILRVPGGPRGVRIGTPVSGVDLVPTALAVLGQPAPEHLDGIDLSGLWNGASPPDRAIFASNISPAGNSRLRAVRRGPFELIRGAAGMELYDVVRDPRERRDLAAERPALAARLAAELDAHLRQAGNAGHAASPLDDAQKQRLRALGYLPDGAP